MNAAELLTLRPSSPLRRPRWRWDLAQYLRNHRSPSNSQFGWDVYVVDAGTMLEAYDTNGDQNALAAAMGVLSDGTDAFQFWSAGEATAPPEGPSLTDPTSFLGPLSPAALARAQLEALVLANKAQTTIARVTGLTVKAVDYYEKWFFDVRDRLRNPGWIATSVIGPLLSPSPLVVLPNLVRAYGYYTGSARIVRTVVGGFDQTQTRKSAKDPIRFFSADAMAAGQLKAALAVRLMDITNGRTYGRIVELHHQAADIQTRIAGTLGSADEDKYKAAAGQLFSRISRGYREIPDEGYTTATIPEMLPRPG